MIKFADMFCGGGLGARGAVMAGCQPVAAVDAWNIAGATYKDNFPSANVIVDSIENVDPVQATRGEQIDLLLTSPECTNHSIAKGACQSALKNDPPSASNFDPPQPVNLSRYSWF